MKTDVVIVGTGVSGLFCALNLPENLNIIMITKDKLENSDSFLAQGGICVLRDDDDYESFMEDTLKAGHYQNDRAAVDVMIRSSREIIAELEKCGVEFAHENGEKCYTREGAHTCPRILFHKDITGKEITQKLMAHVMELPNVTMLEYTTMADIICRDNKCIGIAAYDSNGNIITIEAECTVFACGGLGGLYTHSTNYRHLTGDALAISLKHNIELQNIDYIQIHPTTLYSEKPGRRFLISESVRGEGAVLLNAKKERFADELLPRDILTEKIKEQMKKDNSPYVWLSMQALEREMILKHFPNIYEHCLAEGYDVTKECIPVVPAQHYFMGGIKVDLNSRTSMEGLYAVGETSCNGVHGANRLASNSLLESLVFAKRAAKNMEKLYKSDTKEFQKESYDKALSEVIEVQLRDREGLKLIYRESVLNEIERMKKAR